MREWPVLLNLWEMTELQKGNLSMIARLPSPTWAKVLEAHLVGEEIELWVREGGWRFGRTEEGKTPEGWVYAVDYRRDPADYMPGRMVDDPECVDGEAPFGDVAVAFHGPKPSDETYSPAFKMPRWASRYVAVVAEIALMPLHMTGIDEAQWRFDETPETALEKTWEGNPSVYKITFARIDARHSPKADG